MAVRFHKADFRGGDLPIQVGTKFIQSCLCDWNNFAPTRSRLSALDVELVAVSYCPACEARSRSLSSLTQRFVDLSASVRALDYEGGRCPTNGC